MPCALLADNVGVAYASLIEGGTLAVVERLEDPAGWRYLVRLNGLSLFEARSLCAAIRLEGGKCFADEEEPLGASQPSGGP